MMNNRIRLAEAMFPEHEIGKQSLWLRDSFDRHVIPTSIIDIPDPFTDANDDYAVLEWMRERQRNSNPLIGDPEWTACCSFFAQIHNDGSNYKIGNYARAALKVLDSQEQE